MAHHSGRRGILASSQEEPPNPSLSSSTMDPTLNKKHSKPSSATTTQPSIKNPDPKPLSKPFYLPKLNPIHKIITPARAAAHKQPTKNPAQAPPCIDTQLQARAMTVSADFDACKFSLPKPKQYQKQQKPLVDAKMEKGGRRTGAIKEATSKEKVKTLSFSSQELLEKKKVQQVVVEESRKKKELQGTRKGDKEVKDLLEGLDIKRMSVSFGGGWRRRSICGSQVELSDFLASSGAKIVSVDMPPFMQIHAIDCARKTHDSLEKFTSKTLALTLKKEFDGVYGPAWHCIVGTSFGSFVTHSVGGFLYFSLDQKMYILLFKTTVQRAD